MKILGFIGPNSSFDWIWLNSRTNQIEKKNKFKWMSNASLQKHNDQIDKR